MAISVTNVNEAPTITSGAAVSFAENATGTVYTVAATDPDAGATLTYSFTGTDAARFNINSTTGAITFKSTPNYEAPTDAGANNVYDVTVRASDGTNITTKAVAITVTNVNEAPVITSAATASFAENGTGTVYTAAATDVDAGTTLTYSLTGTDAAKFNIDATTGVVTFKSSPNYEAPTDSGANNVYNVTVRRFRWRAHDDQGRGHHRHQCRRRGPGFHFGRNGEFCRKCRRHGLYRCRHAGCRKNPDLFDLGGRRVPVQYQCHDRRCDLQIVAQL